VFSDDGQTLKKALAVGLLLADSRAASSIGAMAVTAMPPIGSALPSGWGRRRHPLVWPIARTGRRPCRARSVVSRTIHLPSWSPI